MKLNVTLLILIIIFVGAYAVLEIFDLSISISKNSDKNTQEEKQNEKLTQDENTDMQTQQPQQLKPEDVTELMGQILKEGTGEQVSKAGDTVSVHYTGVLLDGTKFDSSVDRGEPFSFTLGAGQVIPGWDQGVVGMKLGEIRQLVIPANMAYGEAGISGTIPPNSPLVFQVEMLEIQAGEVQGEGTEELPVSSNPDEAVSTETPTEEPITTGAEVVED